MHLNIMARVPVLGLLLAFASMASVLALPAELFDAPLPFSAKDGAPYVNVLGKSIRSGDVRTARMNIKALASQPEYLSLSLFQGLTVVAKKNSDTEDHGYGDHTVWSGHINGTGPGLSSVTIATGPDGCWNGLVRGCKSEDMNEPCENLYIRVDSDAESGCQKGSIYKGMEPAKEVVHKIPPGFRSSLKIHPEDSDLSEFVSSGGRRKMSGSGYDAHLRGSGSAELPHRQLSWMQRPTNIIHDVLIVYTEGVANQYGSDSAVINRALIMFAQANQAYTDSGIPLTLRLVTQPVKVSYRERGASQSLNDLSWGEIPGVHALREQYGADLVTLLTTDYDTCGIAWVLNGYSAFGYSVVMSDCIDGRVYAHELGHLQGCDHNLEESIEYDYLSYTPFSFGHRRCDLYGSNFASIMSYDCVERPNGNLPYTQWLWLFSNPNINVTRPNGNSYPMGDAKTAFCARAIAQTAKYISNYRATVTAGPVPPTIACSSTTPIA
jgi:hypothetical protein